MKDETSHWILITGGSKGIGKGLTKLLASEGYDIVFTYLSSVEDAKALEQEMSDDNSVVKGYQCDGRNAAEVESLCARLVAERGAPYALINNMGITADEMIFSLDLENYQNTISTNLDSAIYFSKSLAPSMSELGDGSIIFMSSVTAFKGNIGQLSYAATKAAMLGVSKTLALELARFNVRVNSIAPGFIETEMVNKIPLASLNKMKKAIPLRRLGSVEDVGNLASFLLSNKASYITGQTFVVDGGLTV